MSLPSKYHNHKTIVQDIQFDSRKEADSLPGAFVDAASRTN